MRQLFIISLAILLLISCKRKTNDHQPIKLIVVLSIDQMRSDYYEIYGKDLTHGLNQLYSKGEVVNAVHYHAFAGTSQGHASLSTGCYPRKHGIIENNVYDTELKKSHYVIEDESVTYLTKDSCRLKKVSCNAMKMHSVGDLIKENNSNSKSFSVAMKDRSSILMGGHKCDRAYWFDKYNTNFVSTDYYGPIIPSWVNEFKASSLLHKQISEGWNYEANDTSNPYLSIDNIENERDVFSPSFPHMLEDINTETALGDFLWNTPYGDLFTLKFAEELILKESLGTDENPDIITVGCSASDYIGHHFGPNSLEIQDYYFKLDQYIGSFLRFLDKHIGKNNYMVILTSDHGVVSFPEVSKSREISAQRVLKDSLKKDLAIIEQKVKDSLNMASNLISYFNYHGVMLDSAINNNDACVALFESLIKQLPYIQEVYTKAEMQTGKSNKEYADFFTHSYSSQYTLSLSFLVKPNYLIAGSIYGTNHDAVYDYDSKVPLIFYNNPKPLDIVRDAYTVDMTPTILKMLGFKLPDQLDGRPLL